MAMQLRKLLSFGNRPRRRPWQLVVRAAAVVAMTMVLLYVSAPLWLSADWLAQRVREELSDLVGAPVTTGNVTVSWARGVRVRQVRVADPLDPAGEAMLELPLLEMDFSPLRILLRHQAAWVTLNNPTVRLSPDHIERWHVLEVAPAGRRLPVKRVSIRQGTLFLKTPPVAQPLRIDIADFQCLAGRRSIIEQLSLSAALVEASNRSPLALTAVMRYSPSGEPRPLVTVNFSNADLARLRLADRLGLPVDRLAGVCRGSVRLPIAGGTILDGAVSLTVDGLDAQPRTGPALPVIDRAVLEVRGNVDLVTGRSSLHISKLLGPGMRLTGKADLLGSPEPGPWQRWRTVQLAGAVNPRTLAALFGDPDWLGTWDIDGDMGVELHYARENNTILATAAVDAGRAVIRDRDRIAKPAGVAMAASLSATGQVDTGRLALKRGQVRVGGNRLSCAGSVPEVETLWRRWTQDERSWTIERVAADLAGLDLAGEWDATDLASLRDFAPAVRSALAEVRLAGRVVGAWRLTCDRQIELAVEAACGVGSRLAVRDWLAKPTGVPMAAEFAAAFVPADGEWTDSRLRFACGRGEATVRLRDMGTDRSDDGAEHASWAQVGYRVRHIESLLACLPRAAGVVDHLGGSAAGEATVRFGQGLMAVDIECDAAQLALAVDGAFAKPAGLPAVVTGRGLWEAADDTMTLSLDAEVAGMHLTSDWVQTADNWRATCDVRAREMGWLVELVPAIRYDGLIMEGGVALAVECAGDDTRAAGRAELIADDLSLDWNGSARRKQRHIPLRATASGQLTRLGESARLEIAGVAARLGDSSAAMTGAIDLDADGEARADLAGEFDLTLDRAVKTVAPELARWASQAGASGRVSGRCRLWGDRHQWKTEGRLDGAGLTFAGRFDGVDFVKPDRQPAEAQWLATVTADPLAVTVNDWRVRLGCVEGVGDGKVYLVDDRSPVVKSQFRLWTDRADRLSETISALSAWSPAGDAEVSGQLRLDHRGLTLPYATVQLRDLSAAYRDRRASATGTMLIEQLRLADASGVPALAVGRFASDDLRLTCDAGAVSVVADLRDLPDAPAGELALLGKQVDVSACRDWLAGRSDQPAVTEEYRAELEGTIARWLDLAKPYAMAAEVKVRADLDLLCNFPDDRVGQLYDARHVMIRGEAASGEVRIEYTAGVNGGTVIECFRTDLTADAPRVHYTSDIRDMVATENLQPQVAALFPGNEVLGSMWRELDVTSDLVEYLAGAVDPRLPWRFVGRGKTTFVDGVTRGRGAPKFVTAVLPGLDLVDYRYDRMVGFAEYRDDGSVHNDMIFRGKTYNLFVEGVTDADNVANYDVGVILARAADAEWHHRYKQGRILLLQQTMRIVNGTKVDERVYFPWPNETVFLFFVKNNYFYRAWLHRQSRGRGPS